MDQNGMMRSPTTRPHFKVSPRVLGPLGAEQLQDPALAILELVKNSWDADAKQVSISVDKRKGRGVIAVSDDGHGMSEQEFVDRWLVIGSSHKRSADTSESGRPLIGEKGLGRLASFALGRCVTITSGRPKKPGFRAEVDWEELRAAQSLEDYTVRVSRAGSRRGTLVEIKDLRTDWTSAHTNFLATHAEFLASVPGERFQISLKVNGKDHAVASPIDALSRLAEATISVRILRDGRPVVESCLVNGHEMTKIVYRDFPEGHLDPRLVGMKIKLQFFRRDEAAKRLSDVLARNEISEVLERYQGIRVYREGINVPPYGLNQDDWAGLEKQRTSTGGPTLVPGNSQLIGEVHISKTRQPHLVVTAGRSGFTDQAALGAVAQYVRWTVRALGTARRAEYLGILSGNNVPARIDAHKEDKQPAPDAAARAALGDIERVARGHPAVRDSVSAARKVIEEALDKNEETLRLYAQLASTGIAATSFAHELRAEFDVVSDAVEELTAAPRKIDKDLIALLNSAWNRIRVFAALFKVMPVKLRRQRRTLSQTEVRNSVTVVLGLAAPDKIDTDSQIHCGKLNLVPAELDSILLNLVSNAVKAIAESKNRESGRLRVRLEGKGSDLEIRVADNGTGISKSVSSVMFEPLEGKFSEGTGMGLPIVKYIAERYKGHVVLVNHAPSGYETEFLVHLRNVVR